VVLWAIFGIELAALVALGVKRRWLLRAARPTLARALEAGQERQGHDARLPLGERESWVRLQNIVITTSSTLALPGVIAVLESELATEWCLAAFVLTALAGTDVAMVVAIVVGMWRGWLPLPEDGDDGGGDDDFAPVPGGPFTRAHVFNLRR
jgi:hypothetical protein